MEHGLTGAAGELVEIARAMHDWQTARDWPDTRFCAEFDVGSSKTYVALRDGKLDGYDVDRWLPAYRAAWAVIQLRSNDGEDLPLFEDLTPVQRLRAAMTDAMRERGNDRLIILEGDPGSGKGRAVECMRQKFGSRIVVVEATETWRESLNCMLGDILVGLGIAPPVSVGKRMEKVIERLQSQRRCLVIDEAHHMGPRGLNTVKTLINRTPGEIVLIGLPILLKRLEYDAYQEARQLIHNRLCERISLAVVEASDAEKMLVRLGGMEPAAARAAAGALARMAQDRGALKFVYRVARRCQRDGAADAETALKVAGKLAAKR